MFTPETIYDETDHGILKLIIIQIDLLINLPA